MGLEEMNVRQVLAQLVRLRTICRSENAPLIDWVEHFLTPLGAKIRRIPGDSPGRFGLLATIGPENRPDGLVLSAHSDVVPVEGQPWTTDPFELTEKDGKLLGRGTSDMKGFLACMLMAGQYASSHLLELKRPLHLAISYDEEIGCVGVHSLLRDLKSTGFKASGVVIGEPTEMRVVSGHKGKLAVKVSCHGQSAHSANPARGCSAIQLACDLVKHIQALEHDTMRIGTHDNAYEVPYSTLQVGLIQGGVAVNIVPDYCEFLFEMRIVPGGSSKEFMDSLRKKAADLLASTYPLGQVNFEEQSAYPSLWTPDDTPFLQQLLNVTKEFVIDANEKAGRVGFGTEGGLFQEYLNVPVAVCGPGSINRAHKADEYILSSELDEGVQFVKRLVDTLVQ